MQWQASKSSINPLKPAKYVNQHTQRARKEVSSRGAPAEAPAEAPSPQWKSIAVGPKGNS